MPRSLRRHLLAQTSPLLPDLGLKAPVHFHIDWRQAESAGNGDTDIFRNICAEAGALGLEGRLFAQACPHDEGLRPDLSFAGCYRTYHPRRELSTVQNIAAGIGHVLAGRRNRHADIYYRRHSIRSERRIDVKFAGVVDRLLLIGTAYIYGNRGLIQYFDSYLSLYINDPVRRCASDRCGSDSSSQFDRRLSTALMALGQTLDSPLDIEFVVTAEGEIFVTQVRLISAAHLAAWDNVEDATWKRVEARGPSTVALNSVGRFSGQPVDLRRRAPTDEDARISEPVFVVNHGVASDAASGTSALAFLDWASTVESSSFGLVIDHGSNRRNDHLDYILMEDPQARFVVGLTALPSQLDAERIRIDSDGFDAKLS